MLCSVLTSYFTGKGQPHLPLEIVAEIGPNKAEVTGVEQIKTTIAHRETALEPL